MKRYAIIVVCFFLCSLFFASQAQTTSTTSEIISPNTVSMPWGSFVELRDRATSEKLSEIREQKYSYNKALYSGKARIEEEDYLVAFDTTIQVKCFENYEVLIPILSSELNLEALSVDGKESTWAKEDEFYKVLISRAGDHTVRAQFTVKFDKESWPRSFYLPLAGLPNSEIILDVPDASVEAEFDPGIAYTTTQNAGRTGIRGYLPPVEGVNIRWLEKSEEKKKMELKMDASAYTYVSLEEEGASAQSEIDFRVLQGETNTFSIIVPTTIDIIEIAAIDEENPISQWFAEEENGSKVIKIYSSYQQSELFKVKITYERTETDTTYKFTIPQLVPQNVERSDAFVAVGSGANVEVSEETVQGVEALDVRFVSEQIRQFAQNKSLYYYKVSGEKSELAFDVKSHEKAPMVNTVVDLVEATSIITESGMVMTKITYHIKNTQAQFFRIGLPDKAKLLSAFLSGNEIQPSSDDAKHILLPIIKSPDASFSLEIAFLTDKKALHLFGWKSVRLATSDIPIGELLWKLYTPRNFQILYFGGNIGLVKNNWVSELGHSIYNAGIKEALAGGGQNYDYNVMGLKSRFKPEAANVPITIEQSITNQVQVQIPVAGNEHNFSAYLVKDFTPRIAVFYISGFAQHGIAFLVSIVVFSFLLWTLMFLLERPSLPQYLHDKKNYLKGLIIFIIFGLSLLLISFGVYSHVIGSVALALTIFAILQNRIAAKKFHEAVKGFVRHLPEIVLGIMLVIFISLFVAGWWIVIIALSSISIILHFIAKKLFDRFGKPASGSGSGIAALLLLGLTSTLFSFTVTPSALAQETIEALSVPPIELRDTQVYVDWDIIQQLLDKIDKHEPIGMEKIDLDYVFGSAKITGHVAKKFAELTIEVPLYVLSEKYVHVPIFSDSNTIVSATLNGQPLAMNVGDGEIYFEARRGSGEYEILKINYIVPVEEQGGVDEFSIESPLIQGGMINLGFEANIQSVTLDGVVWQKKTGQTVEAALDSTGQLRCELAPFIRKIDTVDEDTKRAKKVYSETYTLLSLEETVATVYSSIRYKVLNDRVREFTIRLPENVVVHDIIGEDLEDWNMEGARDGITTYRIKVLYPITDQYDLSVQYQIPLKEGDKELVLPNLEVVGVARDIGYIGIEMKASAELVLKNIDKARVIDIRELNEIIKSDATAPIVYAVRYTGHPFAATFDIQKHGNVEMDAAIADRIEYTYVISPEGKVLSQARMIIRNSRKQFASFILPKGGQMLNAFLDGESIKPSLGGKGEILLPLKRQSTDPFTIEVVFEGKDVFVNNFLGYTRIRFPLLDIPASIVSSDIYIPDGLRHSSLFGNFQQESITGFVPWGQVTTTSPVGGTDEGFGGARDIEKSKIVTKGAELAPPPLPQVVEPQEQQILIQGELEPAPRQEVTGTLPLKIDLPKRGTRISSAAFYILPNASLKECFFFCNGTLFILIYCIALAIFIAIGWFIPTHIRPMDKSLLYKALCFVVIFYLIPFPWKKIAVCIIAGLLINKGVQLIKSKLMTHDS